MKKLLLFFLMILGCCGRFDSDAHYSTSLSPASPFASSFASSLTSPFTSPFTSSLASLPALPADPVMIRHLSGDEKCRQWVDSVFKKMNLKERIGQLFIYTIAPQQNKANRDLLHRVVKDYKVGGLLFSGGLMQDQVALTNEAQGMADVPLMITFDGEWGLSMRLRNTPVFPRNMVLGCIQNDSLLYEYGREIARECRELGVQVNFAPVADVNINPKNPVINTRSFGESPANVADKVIAYSKGLEDGGVLSVSKHFPGHGDTDTDSHHTLPTLSFTRARLDSVELYPFRKAIQAGLSGMMVGHLEVPVLEPKAGLPSSLSRNVVHGLLAQEMNFRGLIFTDALAMKGVSANHTNICLQALKAGHDLLLVPRRLKEEADAILDAVKSGELTEEEINAKCKKVLTYKYALGLSKKPFVRLSGLDARLNTAHTRDLIRRLNQAAITVLENKNNMFPLNADMKEIAVLNVGNAKEMQPFLKELSAHMKPAGTKPAVFQLRGGLSKAAYKQLNDSLSQYKRILVSVTEDRLAPYQSFFTGFNPGVPVGYLLFIPAKQVLQIRQGVSAADAVVLAHSSSEDVQKQVAKILYAGAIADGRLSASIGELFATGDGITITPQTQSHFIPEEHGMNSRMLARIDEIAEEGIREGAYPGCQIVVLKDGKEMYNKAFGSHTLMGVAARPLPLARNAPGVTLPVSPTDVYDLASLTKVTATLLAVMKLCDKGQLNLTDRASDYLSWLQGTDKKDITVRQLLLHESGLPSTIFFYLDAIDKESYEGTLFKAKRDTAHPVQIGDRTWANPNFRFTKGLTSKVRTAEHTLQVCDSLWLKSSFKQKYLQKIVDTPLRDQRYRYSCVGFILLQQLVEKLTGMSMDAFLEKEFYAPMGLERTGYSPASGRFSIPKAEIIPSSIDPFLRKTVIQGFVHDEAAAFQGGVSGNAGLFSNATEVARICQMLLNGGELDGKRYLSKETCRVFTTTVSKISRRGLGFDKPDRRNLAKSPCAASAPASVYGHTGFTGTCAWVDPQNGLVYVFLCNRIFPDVWNTELMKKNIRTRIQEEIYKALLR
ncbi:glycoside hydrolase family 3 N-terminal domain-containing protein [Bacteroides sp. UBA939]|uniref:glycoside hydrolase family 3 N-terminal domain-containing protein n=1 Tax=Bacteroides sp. UBA939 TaxID=1946092 RepID=UPI0025C5C7DA|nr:glycoside hydrolase family 3 N-terminal domain-containing protein [Bacteroides sp. UBA939]